MSISRNPAKIGIPVELEISSEFFTEARLQSLIELALANNHDLRVAILNVGKVNQRGRVWS